MNKCAKFHKDSPSDKKLNSISRARLNFQSRPFLCTTLYRNLMQASNFGGTFDQLFLWFFSEIFTEDASLLPLYQVSKKSKMTKNSNRGGPASRAQMKEEVFTDILVGFSFNNRVLRLPAIVLLNTTFRPGNSGLLGICPSLLNRPIYTFMSLCLGVATHRLKLFWKKC